VSPAHALAEAARRLGAQSRRTRIKALVSLIAVVGGIAAFFPIPPALGTTAITCLLLLVLLDLLRELDLDWSLVAIVLAGIGVYLGYLSYTGPLDRNYDAYDQTSYIHFVEQNARLPPTNYCLSCYHPPLYYAIAAIWVRLAMLTRLASYGRCLQFLSLVIWVGFVVFAALITKRFGRSGFTRNLAVTLIVFWPYSIMNSVRVNNDILVIALMTAAIYFMIRWFEDHRRHALEWATGLSGLSLLTKSNGYIVATVLIVLLAWKNWRTIRQRSTLREVVPSVAFLGGCGLLGSMNPARSGPTSWCETVLGKACQALRVPQQLAANGVINYIYFDFRSFLSEPFINTYRPETGSDYFWNTLLKSSLFGTYSGSADPQFADSPNWMLALGLNILVLGMVAYVLIGLVNVTREHIRRYRVLLLFSVTSVVFLAGFRAMVPLAHHADFRFVLPLLVPGCLFFALTVNRFRRGSRALERIGYGLGVVFVVLTVVLFMPGRNHRAKTSLYLNRMQEPITGAHRAPHPARWRHGSTE
jgi:hypothetical protein